MLLRFDQQLIQYVNKQKKKKSGDMKTIQNMKEKN